MATTGTRGMVHGDYYSDFQGATFVVQVDDEAVEVTATTRAILRSMDDLVRHGIRVLCVFGTGTQFEASLRRDFGVAPHPETNRLIIPESVLPRMEQEHARIVQTMEEIGAADGFRICTIPQSAIRVERRIGHGSTGVPASLNLPIIRSATDQSRVAVVGFGGEDDAGRFLHVPSISLAADLAVALKAQKLFFLMHSDGIQVPHPKRGTRQLSFADLEELLCLLQRQDQRGEFVVSRELLPIVHASISATAGGVGQVHWVSYARLLEEVLTRTGVGTMIERYQSHHVDYARPEDLDEIERLQEESQQFRSSCGTPYVVPLDRAALARLLPHTLLLRHRSVIIGKVHTSPVPGAADAIHIGGFVVAENHQDSQQGQLLLSETLARLREHGHARAVAITASPRAQGLFRRLGGTPMPAVECTSPLVNQALQRYAPEERASVEWIEFVL